MQQRKKRRRRRRRRRSTWASARAMGATVKRRRYVQACVCVYVVCLCVCVRVCVRACVCVCVCARVRASESLSVFIKLLFSSSYACVHMLVNVVGSTILNPHICCQQKTVSVIIEHHAILAVKKPVQFLSANHVLHTSHFTILTLHLLYALLAGSIHTTSHLCVSAADSTVGN